MTSKQLLSQFSGVNIFDKNELNGFNLLRSLEGIHEIQQKEENIHESSNTENFSMCKTLPKKEKNLFKTPKYTISKIDLTKSISSKQLMNKNDQNNQSLNTSKMTSINWLGTQISYAEYFSESDEDKQFNVGGLFETDE